jgi:hypothetical protein
MDNDRIKEIEKELLGSKSEDLPHLNKIEDFVKYMESKGVSFTDEEKVSMYKASESLKELRDNIVDAAWMEHIESLASEPRWIKLSMETKMVCKFFFESGARKGFYGGVQTGKELAEDLLQRYKREAQERTKNN